jgi:quinate dehydrogenase (quinone)
VADAADGLNRRSWFAIATGVILVLVGAPIAYGGAVLIGLGGSLYYLPIGLGLVVSGLLVAWQRLSGLWLYAIIYVVTLVWAVAEVGFDFWPLAPRVIAPTALAVPVLLCLASMTRSQVQARVGNLGAATIMLLLVAFGIAAMYPHNAVYGEARSTIASAGASADEGDWTAYGRTNEGRRFAPFSEINKHNIGQLQVAWTFHSGDGPDASVADADENTPLQIGDKLITCSSHSIVHALDVETGKVLWTYDPHARSTFFSRCRGVGYFKASPKAGAQQNASARPANPDRVVMTTVDDRLIELDLVTGKPSEDFGKAGIVDLRAGIGDYPANYLAYPTSAPTVAAGLIVVGGAVIDSVNVDVPSGVVRAFDALTGELRWAWDLGNPTDPNAQLSNGAVYTRGTPNVWAPPSVDEKLGLVFLPTGNPSPDHWGGYRTPAEEKYGSSVVALELATGKVRWVFQTTHHDLWDYDVASQPTLYDIPDDRGGRIPALIQPTKRGQIFVLDRRTGTPITRVQEEAVPQGAARGDRTSPTQPYSVGMPTISSPKISESDMWGLSPLDQLWCRIAFRKLHYVGDFTPPHADEPGLLFPGTMGGMNWGGASIDETNEYLIINDVRIGKRFGLIPRDEADHHPDKVKQLYGTGQSEDGHGGGLLTQTGTPFAAVSLFFMSPLNVPCQAPPYGTLTAIDLGTKHVAWQVPMGTPYDRGPLEMKTYLPMPVGLPTGGGSLVTKSGLIFFAGTQDFYLRAIDSSTGREIWKSRLPVGADATPMSYISPVSKRQFIVISAGGAPRSSVSGDYVIAYTLHR